MGKISLPNWFIEAIKIVLIMVLAFSVHTAFAQIFPLPDASQYGDVPSPSPGTAEQQFYQLVWGAVQNARFILGAVAILMLVYAGFRMIIGWGKDDTYATQRNNILYAIVGLAVVGLAGELANIFLVSCREPIPGQPVGYCIPGGLIGNANSVVRTAMLFNKTTQLIITFIKYFIGAVAVFELVRSGLRMVTMGSSEDKLEQDKKVIFYSVLGLLLIIITDTLINQVLYKIDITQYSPVTGAQPTIDPQRGIQELIGFTNFVVGWLGPIAILALVAGGVMYMLANGEDDKVTRAKRLIFAAMIGIIIIYGAFAIVNTFISGNFAAEAP